MAEIFPTCKLGEVASIKSGFAFKSRDMGIEGCPVIKIGNINPPNVDIYNVERVPFDIVKSSTRIEKFLLEEGDALVAMTGATVGKLGRFPKTSEAYYLNQRVGKLFLNKPDQANYDFLYYVLSQKKYVEQIFTSADGSAQANVSGGQIEAFKIPLPPLAEQIAIASVLGTLDDKIENNRRMNETLEEMARAIFKSWFVDFDPVHAKAAGNTPAHMDAETTVLFPNSFDDDGLPVGWINKTLGDFIEIQNGYAFKSKDWTDEGIPVVKIGSVKPSIVDLSNCSFVSAEVAEQKRNFQLRVGDILIGLTGYVGEVGRVPPADKMPMLNQRVGRVVFKRESFEPFVYAAMRLPEFKSFAESQSHGSAQANVSTKQLQEYPVVVADNLLIEKFNALLESYFEKILIFS